METALLQYPVDKVYQRMQKILAYKGFVIVSTNEMQGAIKAHKRRFLKKDLLLDVSISKIDEKATRVDLSINADLSKLSQKVTFAKSLEEELWNAIYRHF